MSYSIHFNKKTNKCIYKKNQIKIFIHFLKVVKHFKTFIMSINDDYFPIYKHICSFSFIFFYS